MSAKVKAGDHRSFELRDNSVEFFEGHVLVGLGLVVHVSAVQHFEQFVVVDAVLHPLGDGLELFEIDYAVFVGVVNGEDSLEAVFGLGISHLGADGVDELIEADGSSFVSQSKDEGEDERISLVQAQLIEHLADFLRVDGAAVVLVEDLEGFLELCVVFLRDSVFPGGGFGGGGRGLDLGSAHWIEIN
jgi:hypothetical protein